MKSIFGRQGIPYTLISDYGPQFACAEFKNFADYYGFDHVTSSSYYAQSNGKSEKGVQIVKGMWKKCLEEHSDPYLALLAYRAAPLQSGQSPAKLLMGRPLRTRLPVILSFNGASASSPQVYNQASQKYYYDRSAKPLFREALPELRIGNPVCLYGNGGWTTKGTVKDCLTPRSCEVETEDGGKYVRNRRHLLRTPGNPHITETSGTESLTSAPHDSIPSGVPEASVSDTPSSISHSHAQNLIPPNTPSMSTPKLRRSLRARKPKEIFDM